MGCTSSNLVWPIHKTIRAGKKQVLDLIEASQNWSRIYPKLFSTIDDELEISLAWASGANDEELQYAANIRAKHGKLINMAVSDIKQLIESFASRIGALQGLEEQYYNSIKNHKSAESKYQAAQQNPSKSNQKDLMDELLNQLYQKWHTRVEARHILDSQLMPIHDELFLILTEIIKLWLDLRKEILGIHAEIPKLHPNSTNAAPYESNKKITKAWRQKAEDLIDAFKGVNYWERRVFETFSDLFDYLEGQAIEYHGQNHTAKDIYAPARRLSRHWFDTITPELHEHIIATYQIYCKAITLVCDCDTAYFNHLDELYGEKQKIQKLKSQQPLTGAIQENIRLVESNINRLQHATPLIVASIKSRQKNALQCWSEFEFHVGNDIEKIIKIYVDMATKENPKYVAPHLDVVQMNKDPKVVPGCEQYGKDKEVNAALALNSQVTTAAMAHNSQLTTAIAGLNSQATNTTTNLNAQTTNQTININAQSNAQAMNIMAQANQNQGAMAERENARRENDRNASSMEHEKAMERSRVEHQMQMEREAARSREQMERMMMLMVASKSSTPTPAPASPIVYAAAPPPQVLSPTPNYIVHSGGGSPVYQQPAYNVIPMQGQMMIPGQNMPLHAMQQPSFHGTPENYAVISTPPPPTYFQK